MLKKIELDYSLLISKFKKGINIQKYLEKNSNLSSGDIVRISSDIQSGSYIKNYKKDYIDLQKKLFSPMINIINSRFSNCNSMLDFGCGELTNSLFFIKNIDSLKKFYACDVSFNRLVLGKYFLKDKLSNKQFNKVNLFCSPISKLPFNDNSIDLIITTHAIESNQKNKKNIIKELFRVSKNGLLLFEPHYEKSSYSQKKRMNFYNYAKGLEKLSNN